MASNCIRTVLGLGFKTNSGAQVVGGAGYTARHRQNQNGKFRRSVHPQIVGDGHRLRRAAAVALREPARPCAAPARPCGLAQVQSLPFPPGAFEC